MSDTRSVCGECEPDLPQDVPFGFSLTDLHMQISMTFHLMRTCNHPYLAELGLGPGQPRMLSYLAVHGVSTQRDIARHFRIDPAAVSRMLDTLGRAGFVRIVPGEDRRRRAVELTEKGTDALAVWDHVCAATDEVMLAGFAPEERATLRGLLDRVQNNMRAHLSGTDAVDVADDGRTAILQPDTVKPAEAEVEAEVPADPAPTEEVRHV